MPNPASKLWERARGSPRDPALIFRERSYTFLELADLSSRVAAGLRCDGLGAGDRVAILCGARLEFIVFEQAILALGATVVPLNIHYTASELAAVLAACDVDAIVVEEGLASRLEEGVLPARLRYRVVIGAPSAHEPVVRSAAELMAFRERLEQPVDCSPDDVALMLQTSATTGRPKGVMLTVQNLLHNYDRTPSWLGLDRTDRILCALPLYNTFALNQCINAMLVTGCTLVLLPRFDVGECLEAIERYRCTFFPAVPTMVQKLLGDPRAASVDLSSIRRMLVGAAPVPAEMLEQVIRRIGLHTIVMTGYGLTEATALVCLDRVELGSDGRLRRPRSVGKALTGMNLRLVDDSGKDVAAGAVGEIWIRGPNVMKAYYARPQETQESLVDGWLRTGDLAVKDAEDNFYIVDRKKDLIIRGGQNVYPAEIEAVLYAHPAVTEAAVIGRPHALLGEAPHGFVALRSGADVALEDLLNHCRTRLAYFKVPDSITVLPELPKGPTGKILRRALK